MKLKSTLISDLHGDRENQKAIIKMLMAHFNYSIRDIHSYNELTQIEKEIIDQDLFEKITDHE